eukprot:1187964-Prorocentrum_minimum.AAC.1
MDQSQAKAADLEASAVPRTFGRLTTPDTDRSNGQMTTDPSIQRPNSKPSTPELNYSRNGVERF